jgi:hypothetical protein
MLVTKIEINPQDQKLLPPSTFVIPCVDFAKVALATTAESTFDILHIIKTTITIRTPEYTYVSCLSYRQCPLEGRGQGGAGNLT